MGSRAAISISDSLGTYKKNNVSAINMKVPLLCECEHYFAIHDILKIISKVRSFI